MACHAARRLLEMNKNLSAILGIEAMAGAQGIELRAPLKTSTHLSKAMLAIRQHCPSLVDDRMVSADIINLAALVHDSDRLSKLDGSTELLALEL
jgi:histidine ammonia-lyase